MTYTDVWIGELGAGEDPLDWGGDWGVGNTPRGGLTPLFPPSRRGFMEPWSTVRARIQSGVYKGKQVDWGAWAAIVTKQDIIALIDEMFGTDPCYGSAEHLCRQLAELRAAVAALPNDRHYALIADEL